MDPDINGVTEERKYFLSVLQTFQCYRKQSLLRIENKEECLNTLPVHHRNWLDTYKTDLDLIKRAIEINSSYIPIVLKNANNIFEDVYSSDTTSHSESDVGTLSEGLDKVQNVFKQLMRDWSNLGAAERKQCYDPIIEEIERQFPRTENRVNVKVLVPGAGLGRLAFEIAARGYVCEGNEFNLFMLIVSFHILNQCKIVDEFEIFPWIHQYCNNLSVTNQMTSVKFPDVNINVPSTEDTFSMVAGDFLEVYRTPSAWHCVATCFFIDCAVNVVDFIETIYLILKPGGVWINLGPLLYHYSGVGVGGDGRSLEPSYEVLRTVCQRVGFVIESEKVGLKTRYCQNPTGMLQYEYESVFFVCRKPVDNVDVEQVSDDNIGGGDHKIDLNTERNDYEEERGEL